MNWPTLANMGVPLMQRARTATQAGKGIPALEIGQGSASGSDHSCAFSARPMNANTIPAARAGQLQRPVPGASLH